MSEPTRSLEQLNSRVLPQLRQELFDFWRVQRNSAARSGPSLDLDCETLILRSLRHLGRGYRVYIEDSGCITVPGCNLDSWTFLVDPLDGTHNAEMGFPAFTTSIALFVNDLLTLGWVYDPNRDEVFCGQRGGGAWADGGSGIRSLRVRDVTQLSQAVVAAFRPRNAEEMDFHQQLLSRSWKFRSLSCSSLEICYIASGIYDAFVDLRKQGSERDCDIAAAALVLREAGGEVFDGHGGPHWIARPGMSSILVRRNLLATASSELAREILEIASSHHPTIPDIGGAS